MNLWLLMDVLAAYVIDLIAGDPYWLPHPVRFIGKLVRKTERFLTKRIHRKRGAKAAEKRRAGVVLCFFVVAVTAGTVWLVLKLAALVHPLLFHILNIYILYTALAARCLAVESKKVYRTLKDGDIEGSRKGLAMLVGRETSHLGEKEIIRGVVETTAENTVDGVISPLVYAFAGSLFGFGAPLVYAFKAASTLDSMVGYMNEKYSDFGKASARFDDILNYIPARFSGFIIPLSSFLLGKGFKRSFLIMLRDRRNHKSPNCAYPEAAVAGALGIRLGGDNVYSGKIVKKPTIGDPDKELEPGDITDTIRIMYMASFLTLVFITLITYYIQK